jgi:imidazolonepropionase-like amidohydrolase
VQTFPIGLIVLALGSVVPAAAQNVTAVTGGTVIGAGGALVPDAVVVVEGARIAHVGPLAATTLPANAVIVDARGKFVTPGLADVHNHVRSGSFRIPQNARTVLTVLLAHGVTTVLNPSVSTVELADLKAATAPETAPFPRFIGTGPIVTIEGDVLGAAVGSPTPETPAAARAAVQALKAAGVDAIKVNRDDLGWASKRRVPVMRPEVLAALVDEAHREGLKVFAHAPLLARAKEVLRAGADGLLHGIIDRPVDEEFLDLLMRNGAAYVPTLSLYEAVADVAGWARRQSVYHEGGPLAAIADSFAAPEFVRQFESVFDNTAFTKSRLSIGRQNLERVFDAGAPVVMGTDSGFYGVLMGASSQIELALMVDAGLTPDAALRAATLNAARMIGRDHELGSVEPGKLADLLILDANPLEDIGNVRRIHRVIKDGVVHDPAQLLANFRVTAPTRGGQRGGRAAPRGR